MTDLAGKAVVISGAGRGVGAACAIGVARRGGLVVVNDVDGSEALRTVDAIISSGGKAVACVADVSDWNAAGHLVQTCIEKFGRIDGLVNNASLLEVSRLDEFDPAKARELLNVNILGAMYCAAHAVKPMLGQRSGSIVNVTSGALMGSKTRGIYAASKGAVASMTFCWALELADFGIRVNAVSPLGATRMIDVQCAYDPESAERARASLPPPEDNVPVVEYLLSDRSKDVTGQIVRIDRTELSLYVHPALQVPPCRRDNWSLDAVADAFDQDLKKRLVPCGAFGVIGEVVPLESGFQRRVSNINIGRS